MCFCTLKTWSLYVDLEDKTGNGKINFGRGKILTPLSFGVWYPSIKISFRELGRCNSVMHVTMVTDAVGSVGRYVVQLRKTSINVEVTYDYLRLHAALAYWTAQIARLGAFFDLHSLVVNFVRTTGFY